MGRTRLAVLLCGGFVAIGYRSPAYASTSTSSGTSTGCRGGIAGIEDSLRGTCCVEACGQCGGSGCGDVDGLTEEDCCSLTIQKTGPSCDTTGTAPCILSDPDYAQSTCPNGLPGVQSGEVCCAEECNLQCGGEGCGTIPGTEGSSDCCTTTILDEGVLCGDGVEAPCIMVEGTYEGAEGLTPAPATIAPSTIAPTLASPTVPPVTGKTPAPGISPTPGATPPTVGSAPITPSPRDTIISTPSPSAGAEVVPAEPPTEELSSSAVPSSSGSSSSDRVGVIVGAVAAATAISLVLLLFCLRRRGALVFGKRSSARASPAAAEPYDPEAAASFRALAPTTGSLAPASTSTVKPKKIVAPGAAAVEAQRGENRANADREPTAHPVYTSPGHRKEADEKTTPSFATASITMASASTGASAAGAGVILAAGDSTPKVEAVRQSNGVSLAPAGRGGAEHESTRDANIRNFNYMLAALEPKDIIGTPAAPSLGSSNNAEILVLLDEDREAGRSLAGEGRTPASQLFGRTLSPAASFVDQQDANPSVLEQQDMTDVGNFSPAERRERDRSCSSVPASPAFTVNWDAASFCGSDYAGSTSSDIARSE